ncbi:MAG: beta strand repeat-containing protein, partial [Verrucomicrobiota bacterium]
MTKQNPNNKTLRLAATAVSVLALCGTAQAQLYWDSNNSTAGFGTAGGTWAAPTTNSASQGWSSSSTGSTALSGTTTTNTTSALNFGTSTNQLGTGTITVSGSVEANSLTFVSSGGSNNTTLSGGNITLGGTTPSITVTNIANTAATTQTIASNIILGANQTWTVNSGGATGIATLSASGRISGGFGITKSGNGNLNLNGNNTYTGGTAINAGRLDIRNANALGTGNVTIASGAFAGVQTASTISNNFIIAGNGTGNGVIQSYANNTVAGLVTLSDNAMIGARTSAGNSTFTLTGGITSNGTDRTLTLNTFGSATIATNQLTISTNSVNLGTGGILDIGHGMNAGGTATFNINVGSNTWGTTIVRGLATAAASTNATLNLGAVNALGSSSSVLQLGSLNTALE